MHGVIAAKTSLAARRGIFESPYNGLIYVVDAITNNSGAAGGVLTTWDGRLLGMLGKELRNSQTNTWLNYVMPISELKTTVEEIVSGRFSRTKKDEEDESPEKLSRRRRYEALDFGIVTVPDVLTRTPAYIDRILPGSEAEKVGLLPNDLILFVGEDLIQSCRMFTGELDRLEASGSPTQGELNALADQLQDLSGRQVTGNANVGFMFAAPSRDLAWAIHAHTFADLQAFVDVDAAAMWAGTADYAGICAGLEALET